MTGTVFIHAADSRTK